MKRFILFVFFPFLVKGQFAPAAGQPGTSAIKKDSSIIVNWATKCRVTRGLQDISNVLSGYASHGDSSLAIGAADGLNVVSLGDGGYAVLNFQTPIKNGNGPDFCVFENSFDAGFIELAFVEVSSDGINYTRFPATCNIQNTLQIGPFDTSSDASKINNLAGKYIANYGVPFDLQELQGTPGLDLNHITHVKIIDVVGCIQSQYARYDKNNNIINDLWSTPFPSGGFDLDAVAVINQVPVSVQEQDVLKQSVIVLNSIVKEELRIVNNSKQAFHLEIYDLKGSLLIEEDQSDQEISVRLNDLIPALYVLKISNDKTCYTEKFVKIN